MERPKVTPEMVFEAATKLAKANGWDTDQAADLASSYRRHMDGYQLAKNLERRHCWEITVSDVNALDCMDSDVREILTHACMVWARENDIQPPLPVGTMTTLGEITGLYKYEAACYEVLEPGCIEPSRRRIVRYEDACAA